VGVKDRLLDDARSFAKEVASLDVEGFTRRTLAILGLAKDSDMVTETEEEDTPMGPAASRGRPHPGHTPDLFVKYPAPGEPGVQQHETGTAHPGPRRATDPAPPPARHASPESGGGGDRDDGNARHRRAGDDDAGQAVRD